MVIIMIMVLYLDVLFVEHHNNCCSKTIIKTDLSHCIDVLDFWLLFVLFMEHHDNILLKEPSLTSSVTVSFGVICDWSVAMMFLEQNEICCSRSSSIGNGLVALFALLYICSFYILICCTGLCRAANLYFLFLALLNWVPVVEAFQKEITMIPLLVVLIVIAIKDALEDYRRYLSDKKVNNNVVQVFCGWVNLYELYGQFQLSAVNCSQVFDLPVKLRPAATASLYTCLLWTDLFSFLI